MSSLTQSLQRLRLKNFGDCAISNKSFVHRRLFIVRPVNVTPIHVRSSADSLIITSEYQLNETGDIRQLCLTNSYCKPISLPGACCHSSVKHLQYMTSHWSTPIFFSTSHWRVGCFTESNDFLSSVNAAHNGVDTSSAFYVNNHIVKI